ncbi:MAG: hypothetical protein PSV26_19000 [Polaromonas sp.]|uniref:hypothetical protein n=1 Tax=Polaromonas sp. TaxID=1869339 RepID=UPI002488791E|nr:hypothetical protein [Polaromonas sp.]MDI1239575.1 hypothetical protein [Polaromonas sp.]
MTHDPAARQEAGPEACRIALLGAAGTGKTRLAGELRAALDGRTALLPTLIADNPPLASVMPARAGAPADPRHFGFDQVLLLGLDLPAPAGLAVTQEAVDRHLRQQLANAGVPYTVVYGLGPQRLSHALGALRTLLDGHQPSAPGAGDDEARRPWVWACDTCSDPACERRLLSDLMARRAP